MILEKFNDLSQFKPTDKTIVCTIINNINNFDELTITDLAKKTYTSNATIIRFCRKLNFRGYKDFKIALLKEIELQKQNMFTIDANAPFAQSSSLQHISENLCELIKSNINNTYLGLDQIALSKALDYLKRSERIFIFAKGDSYIRAKSFKNRLMKIDRYAILADENHEGAYNSRNATQNDCVIFLTYSASHYEYLNFVKIFKTLKIPTIIITANDKSPLAKQCDAVLKVPLDESFDSKIACFASQISFEYVLDILYSAIFNADYQINYNQKMIKEKYVNKILEGSLLD